METALKISLYLTSLALAGLRYTSYISTLVSYI
jgi:hypothetical protein